ncbi:hypothetical protein [Sphingobacterium wenxiniae]|uniref:hypothetical protein n=1 Tax=Sphingobacterium wenxiniae TaxID=683125 RepID=UPI00147F01BE|nr:hypothetical protein [Sphingobacterium wenxiniae]
MARLQVARAAVAIGRPTHRSQSPFAKNNANPIGTTHPSQSRHSVEPIRPSVATQIVIFLHGQSIAPASDFVLPWSCPAGRLHYAKLHYRLRYPAPFSPPSLAFPYACLVHLV